MSRIATAFATLVLLSTAAMAEGVQAEVCDDGTAPAEWFLDGDGDGYGDPEYSVLSCEAPAGFVDNDADLHDGNADILDA